VTGWIWPLEFGPLLNTNAKLKKVMLNLFLCDASKGSEKVHFIFTWRIMVSQKLCFQNLQTVHLFASIRMRLRVAVKTSFCLLM